MQITRGEFMAGALAAGVLPTTLRGEEILDERAKFQREIDDITPADWNPYYKSGLELNPDEGAAIRAKFPALQR